MATSVKVKGEVKDVSVPRDVEELEELEVHEGKEMPTRGRVHLPTPHLPAVHVPGIHLETVRVPAVRIPSVHVSMPTGVKGRVLWWGGLTALATFGVVEWPVAVIVGAGSWVAEQYAKAADKAQKDDQQ